MYTYNVFCFGHNMMNNPELNNKLREYITYSTQIKNKKYVVEFPYHGGQVCGDVSSCIFGVEITDNDNNKNFLNKIRNAKESDYIDEYNEFLKKLIKDLDEDKTNAHEDCDIGYDYFVEELKNYIQTHKPEFYLIEVSS